MPSRISVSNALGTAAGAADRASKIIAAINSEEYKYDGAVSSAIEELDRAAAAMFAVRNHLAYVNAFGELPDGAS